MDVTSATYPITSHPTWNVLDPSKLQDYLTCPRLFFYRHVLGWQQETTSNHLVFGEAIHRALEHLLTHGYSTNSVLEAYEGRFLPFYRDHYPADTDEMFSPKTPDNALRCLAAYTNKYRDDLFNFEVLHTETSGTVPINDEDVLYFRMDSVLRDRRTNRIFSLEHKTASSPWKWEMQWPLKIQVGCYTHCLYCMYPAEQVSGVEINGLFFKKVKDITKMFDFSRFPAFKTMDQLQVWLWTVNDIIQRVKADFSDFSQSTPEELVLEAFAMNSESCTKYFGCPYHDLCCSWTNPLREAGSPPLGFTQEYWDPRAREAKEQVTL